MLYVMNFWRYLDLVVIPLEMIDCNWRIASHYVVTDLDVTQRLGIAMCISFRTRKFRSSLVRWESFAPIFGLFIFRRGLFPRHLPGIEPFPAYRLSLSQNWGPFFPPLIKTSFSCCSLLFCFITTEIFLSAAQLLQQVVYASDHNITEPN